MDQPTLTPVPSPEPLDADVVVAPPPETPRATDRTQAIATFVRDNPALTIAGGIAAGLLVGALLPRRARPSVGARAAKLAEVAGAAIVAFGRNAADEAADAGGAARTRGAKLADRAQRFGALAAGRAGVLGALAAKRAGEAGDSASDAVGALSRSAARRLARVEKRAARQLAATGRVAARKGGEIGDAAGRHLGEAGQTTLSGVASLLAHLGAAVQVAGKRMGEAADDLQAKARD